MGDTAWLLLSRLNREETEHYLSTRQRQGFNVIQVMVLHTNKMTNRYDAPALVEAPKTDDKEPLSVKYDRGIAIEAADGPFIICCGNDRLFAKLASALGKPEWSEDPRFATNRARVAHRAELIPLIRQVTVFRTTAEWVSALEQAGVPCGPINDLAQVFADPQVQARGLRVELPHQLAGTVPQVASPIRLSETPVEYRNPPPTLGQHNREVLGQIGIAGAAFDDLVAAGVSAADLVLAACEPLGGRGGGRPAMAQGKGTRRAGVADALAAIRSRLAG